MHLFTGVENQNTEIEDGMGIKKSQVQFAKRKVKLHAGRNNKDEKFITIPLPLALIIPK